MPGRGGPEVIAFSTIVSPYWQSTEAVACLAKKPVSKERTHFPICFSTRTFTVWSYLQAGSRRFVTPRRGILITRRLIKPALVIRPASAVTSPLAFTAVGTGDLTSRSHCSNRPLKSLEPEAQAVEPAYDFAMRALSASEKEQDKPAPIHRRLPRDTHPLARTENRFDRIGDAAKRLSVIVLHVVIGFYSIRDYLRIDRRPITSRYFCGLTLRR